MTIVTIVGARPQFVKAAAVSRVLRASAREVLVHTGQHYDENMSEVFFRELGIPRPDYDLGVGSGTHGAQTARMLTAIEEVLERERPDAVLVYGDTNSTLAGALAAAKLRLLLAHVEAGLRSFNRGMPEEINRVVADHVSDVLFCPSGIAAANLAAEGITAGVHVVGDVMADVLMSIVASLPSEPDGIVSRLGLDDRSYLLATVHRAENTDDPVRLSNIVRAFEDTGEPVVMPIHPRTRRALDEHGVSVGGRVRVIEPVGYLDILQLQRSARLILTDSGGVQKEAYWMGVPCVTLRDETEWVETVAAGWNVVVGTDPARIREAVRTFDPPALRPPLYGDGHAAERIAAVLTA